MAILRTLAKLRDCGGALSLGLCIKLVAPFLLVTVSSLAVAATCTEAQGFDAEDAVDHLDTWKEVYRAFH